MSEPLRFRNVDADPDSPVESWPTEALEAALTRGSLRHWGRINAAIRAAPWGRVARTVESILGYSRPYGVAELMERAISRARSDADSADRAEVAAQVRGLLADTGRSRAEVAALLGTSTSRLSTYATGRVTPSAVVMVRLRRLAGGVDRESPLD